MFAALELNRRNINRGMARRPKLSMIQSDFHSHI